MSKTPISLTFHVDTPFKDVVNMLKGVDSATDWLDVETIATIQIDKTNYEYVHVDVYRAIDVKLPASNGQ